jgi:hypothetical protein
MAARSRAFPSGPLEDHDASGPFLAFLAGYVAALTLYHRALTREGRRNAGAKGAGNQGPAAAGAEPAPQSKQPRRARRGSTASGASGLSGADELDDELDDGGGHEDLDEEGAGEPRGPGAATEDDPSAPPLPSAPRENYWDALSDCDVRESSMPQRVGARGMLLARLGGLLLCGVQWIAYLRDFGCCHGWDLFSSWTLALVSLLFLAGAAASLQAPRPDGSLSLLAQAWIVLLETAAPTALLLAVLHWGWLRGDDSAAFPVLSHWGNDLAALATLALVLAELALDRMLLASRRWFNFAYFSAAYLFFLICLEKLRGPDYVRFTKLRFLRLAIDAFPDLVYVLILHQCCHYALCALGSLKQWAWLQPLPLDLEPAPAPAPAPSALAEPLLAAAGPPGSAAQGPPAATAPAAAPAAAPA